MIEAVGKTWITISWQQVVFVFQYILTVSGGSSVVNVSVNGSERQTNVTGLLPDTEYSVTVVVVDRNGQTSLPSAIVFFVFLFFSYEIRVINTRQHE